MILTGLLLLALAVLGAPLFAVIAAGALLGFARSGVDPMIVAMEIFRIAETPVLLAIPLFTFAGYLLGESGAPRRLVRTSNALFGWLPGGLAVVALIACALFTAFTGASGVTIVALGALLLPALNQVGYPERFNLGLVTTSGSLGLLFAPSLPLILYGIVASQPIDQLFLAGLMPGVLMLVLMSLWAVRVGHRSAAARAPGRTFDLREAAAALRAAAWEVPLPVIVLGGVYSGVFAVSEAAAVTAVYVLVVEVLVYREIPLRRLPGIMRDSMVLVGGILIILGASLASTNYMIDAQVPTRLFEAVTAHVSSQLTFLILLNVFLLVLGTLLDIFSALVIVVPLLLPLAAGYGVDPIHLGIIFLANMQIGYCTPPVGMSLFIASYRFDKPVVLLYRAALPFLGILLVCVLLITYWPWLSLALIR
ncbi:MAG TPA: TRAP transporter large permease subunit [Thermoanaerobaculales bacterium]|nr:TRAP transporter large permease subunit [Thermoanaerobaculales bacterium]HPA81724.1 TRAP transporter large permease subunit [Thermoanaerobaculales bacterium]HQL31210.1 TRAP transporter large permease subunit [Thermoanaerobaculales bacterium]